MINKTENFPDFKVIKLFMLLVGLSITVSCSEDDDATALPVNEAPTVWSGERMTFTKNDGADPSEAQNQDRLTDLVWITRGNNGGQIYNAASETVVNSTTSPSGTAWAVGSINDIDDLEFGPFRSTVRPQDVVGKQLILHLIEDNIYLEVEFISWSNGKAGGFAYERTTK